MALLEAAIRRLALRRAEFDVLVVYFPEVLETVFRVSGDGYDFDLHDATKALTASLAIPSQIILDRSIGYRDRCTVLWSLATAVYTKAGGIPWKLRALAQASGIAFLGLAYVLRPHEGGRRVLSCCSQLFDSHGQGMEFLLFTADDFVMRGRNPFLKREDMRRLLSRSVELFVRQNGHRPRRLVVHKTTHFTRDEQDGAAEALCDLDDYELLQVQQEHRWLGVRGSLGKSANYPVPRGTALPISKFSYLLWTHGDAPGMGHPNRSFFQGQKGIPHPLLITQHAGTAPLDQSAAELIGLTKMSWNTARLYNVAPVTTRSAGRLGKTSKYMRGIRSVPYQYRLFM